MILQWKAESNKADNHLEQELFIPNLCCLIGTKALDKVVLRYYCDNLCMFSIKNIYRRPSLELPHLGLPCISYCRINDYSRVIIISLLNPLYTGRLFQCCLLEKFICHFRSVRSISSFLFYFWWKVLLTNSVDPDQTPHYVVSDLGLHCLSMTLLGVSQ